MRKSLLAITIGTSLCAWCLPVTQAATWTGTTGVYANADNWDAAMVPCNELTVGDNAAVINANVFVNQNVALCTVSSLTLGADAVFQPLSGTFYSAATATIDGRINGQGGAMNLAQADLGPASAISAGSGSVITIGANSLSSTEPADVSKNILVSSGAGSLIELASVSTLDASFDSNNAGGSFHRINVQNGGAIDLSGLTNITGPVDTEDRLLIDATGGGSIDFSSLSNVTAGGFVVIDAADGSTLNLPAASALSSTIFSAQPGGSIAANASSWTYDYTSQPGTIVNLMVASGTGVLDLSGATALNLATPGPLAVIPRQRVVADGGQIDLSGVELVSVSADAFSSFEFRSNNAGEIDLSGLANIDATGDQPDVVFETSTGGTMDLSSLSTAGSNGRVLFNALTGTQIALPSITDIANARFEASNGSQIVANASAFVLNDLRLIAAHDSAFVDLSGARELSFRQPFSYGIEATGDSDIDLSNLARIPANDDATFANEILALSDSRVRLDNLTSIGTGNRLVIFAADRGIVEMLSLESMDDTVLEVASQSTIAANGDAWTYAFKSVVEESTVIMRANGDASLLDLTGLTNIDAAFENSLGAPQSARIVALNGGTIDLPSLVRIDGPADANDTLTIEADGGVINLDSLQTIAASGLVDIRALGGAQISLPSIESLQRTSVDAAENSAVVFGEDYRTYAFASPENSTSVFARENSRIDMSSVTRIDSNFAVTGPSVVNKSITADDSEVDLSSLSSIEFPSGDETQVLLRFNVRGDGVLRLGPLDAITGAGRARLAIEPQATLEFPSSCHLTGNTWLLGEPDSRINIHGDFSFDNDTTSFFNLTDSRVAITSDTVADIEVGGANGGANDPGDSNFGIGQLTIGTQEQTVAARLVDAIDNGRGNLCATASMDREALYLFGLEQDASADGLRIANGSTLDLGGLDVYAEVGGILMHLNPLVTPGVPYPFDEGFLAIDTVLDIDRDGVADGVDNCVIVANTNQTDSDGDGFGNACDADLNNDMIVNNIDLGLLKLAFHSSIGSADWNPDADFNGDLQVNAVDLGLFRQRFFKRPGPACPVSGI